MDGITPGAIKSATLAIQINSSLQKKVMESAEQNMASLLRTMPQSASLPGIGASLDVRG